MFPHTTCMLWNINNSRTKWQQGCTMDEADGDASDKVDTECQQERWVQMNNVEFPVRYSVSKKIGTQNSTRHSREFPARQQHDAENVKSSEELGLSTDFIDLFNQYGIQFADTSPVSAFLRQLGITSDFGTDPLSMKTSLIQENLIHSGDVAVENAVPPIVNDFSAAPLITASRQTSGFLKSTQSHTLSGNYGNVASFMNINLHMKHRFAPNCSKLTNYPYLIALH